MRKPGTRFLRTLAGIVLTVMVLAACASPRNDWTDVAPSADPFAGIQDRAADLVRQTLERGGFTVDPRTGLRPSSGYAVNTGTSGLVADAAKFFSGRGNSEGQAQLTQYVRDNAGALGADPGLAVGAWYDRAGGVVVLSLAAVVAQLPEAIRLGLAHHQQSVYDLAAGRAVPTGGQGR